MQHSSLRGTPVCLNTHAASLCNNTAPEETTDSYFYSIYNITQPDIQICRNKSHTSFTTKTCHQFKGPILWRCDFYDFFYDNKSTLGASRMLWKYQNAQSMYQRHTESIKSSVEVAVYKTAFKSLARTSVRLRCNNCAVTALNQSPEASLSTLSLSWQHSLTVS